MITFFGDVLNSREILTYDLPRTKGQSKKVNVSLRSPVPYSRVKFRIRFLLLCISEAVCRNACLLESRQISDRR